MNDKKIVFIMASVSQPRCLKRITSFVERGYEVNVFGFNRGHYLVNANNQSFEIEDLGKVDNGRNYIAKFIYEYKTIKRNVFLKTDKNVICYAFSFDIAIICLLNGRKYIYEISDLVYGYFNVFLAMFFAIVDKFVIKKSLITVFTSQGFVNYLFNKKKINNIVVIPNRVNKKLKGAFGQTKKSDFKKIVFGYVGAFRYPNTIFRFAKIIGEKFPDYEFSFYGDSPLKDQVVELSNRYKNVNYFGEFANPDDLIDIYNKIDVVVACYDVSTLNEQLAEPNKLYESLCFKKPIIVSKGTYLAERVKMLKCGYIIDAMTDTGIEAFFYKLKTRDLIDIADNISKINQNEIFDEDSLQLFDKIEKK